MIPTPTEWKCDCGAWVPIGFSRHTHYGAVEPTLAEMLLARERGDDESALDLKGEPTHVWRSAKHETR